MNDLNEEDFWRELFVVKMRLEERRIAALQANPDLPRSQEAKKPRSQGARSTGIPYSWHTFSKATGGEEIFSTLALRLTMRIPLSHDFGILEQGAQFFRSI
jgi:hypothetical protein